MSGSGTDKPNSGADLAAPFIRSQEIGSQAAPKPDSPEQPVAKHKVMI